MKIVVVYPDPQGAADWQQALHERLPGATVSVWSGHVDPLPADYAVGWGPPPDFFARQPTLRAFFSAGAGVDHLMRHEGLPAALPVIRLEDAGMAAQMVDYCSHELLHLAGRHHDYAALQAQRRWHEVDALPRESLPVGVLGLGVLGGHVARALAAAGWPVSGYSRTARTIEGVRTFDGPGGWHAFLAATRVLILMAPLTPATENLVDADALARLQPGGWLINVARGALVVDADLLSALERGQLSGATLDVFRREPLAAEHPFWTHPRIRITPHVSAPTRIAESAAQVAGKVLAMERVQRPSGWVDRARGY